MRSISDFNRNKRSLQSHLYVQLFPVDNKHAFQRDQEDSFDINEDVDYFAAIKGSHGAAALFKPQDNLFVVNFCSIKIQI